MFVFSLSTFHKSFRHHSRRKVFEVVEKAQVDFADSGFFDSSFGHSLRFSLASVYSRPKEISLIKEWHRLRNCNHSQAVNSEGDIDQGEIVQKTRRNASG